MVYLIFAAFVIGILLNYFYTKSDIIKNWVNTYLVWFGLPFYILLSLIKKSTPYSKFGVLILLLVLFFIFANLLNFLIIKRIKMNNKKKASLFLASVYTNSGYLGIPLAGLFFHEIGVVIAAVYSIVSGLFHYSFGTYFSNAYSKGSKSSLREMLKFPLFWSILIAFILSFFLHNAPEQLFQFSRTAVYLAPFVIGLTFRVEKIELGYIHGFVLKFIFLPIIMFALLLLIKLPLAWQNSLLLLAILPPALSSTIIAIKYKFDEHFISGFTSYSTLIFLIVILIVSLLV